MRYSLILLLTIFYHVSIGQKINSASIRGKHLLIKDFVPAGWVIIDSARGDLNKDKIADAAVVIQARKSILQENEFGDTVPTQHRKLLILLCHPISHQFELVEQSNTFILTNNNPYRDDPYDSISIRNGVLCVQFHLFFNAGSWYMTNAIYKFRYQQVQFCLIGADISFVHRATLDFSHYSYNFLTQKRVLVSGNYSSNVSKTIHSTISPTAIKTLKTLKIPFDWAIEKDVLL